MNQLITRASISEIAKRRNLAIESFKEARKHQEIAAQKIKEAHDMLKVAAPFSAGMFQVSDRDMDKIEDRHYIDGRVWDSVIFSTDLNYLMDKKAKDELRQQLIVDAPEFTEENAYATIEGFMADSGEIFRRGIAIMFSKLDRRFRSHSGWKIGNRVILENILDGYGSWNHYRDHRSTLQDIERTFLILDGKKPVSDYNGIVGQVDLVRQKIGWGRLQKFEVDSEFYKIRFFKNGNAHLWFKREDLVTQANKMIGEYYGEVIPEERKNQEKDHLNDPKRELAKNYGFFPTPESLALRTVEDANLYSRDNKALKILEPSAGTGNLARPCVLKGHIVDCIEYQKSLADNLQIEGIYNKVICADFLSIQPETTGLYDRVIMNPPFDRERDIDHVFHAMKFLNEDGLLISIMSAHTEFAETKKAVQFRKYIEGLNGKFFDNPQNSFTSVGTNVNTITLKVYKNGRSFWR